MSKASYILSSLYVYEFLLSTSTSHHLQIPVSCGVSLYAAAGLYKGHRVIASTGNEGKNFRVHQLVIYCILGVLAGVVGGLLGLGGGFIMGPLFLELGVPPQVSLWFSLK
jgi:H+/Cl- antiporter ClcA